MAKYNRDIDDLRACGFEHVADIDRGAGGHYEFRVLRPSEWAAVDRLYAFVGDDRVLSIGETGESLRSRCNRYKPWFKGKTGKTPGMLALYMAEFQGCRTVKVFSKEPETVDIPYLVERGIQGLSARKVEEDALNAYFRPKLWRRGRKHGAGVD